MASNIMMDARVKVQSTYLLHAINGYRHMYTKWNSSINSKIIVIAKEAHPSFHLLGLYVPSVLTM
jgi:hypothetical protein